MFDISFERVAKVFGYLTLGVVGTGVIAVVLLRITQPLQTVVYDLSYSSGPSEATETAIIAHFALATIVGITVPALVAEYLSQRFENLDKILRMLGVGVLGLLVFFATWVIGVFPPLLGILGIVLFFALLPVVLYFRYDVRSGALPAIFGGIPVLFLLLFALGFGLGWGWGYIIIAEEVPESTVNESQVVDFDGVPEVRDDLFSEGNCENGENRSCILSIRGYEHEKKAANFLKKNGVYCPYPNSNPRKTSLVTEHEGRYYRVSCSHHGD